METRHGLDRIRRFSDDDATVDQVPCFMAFWMRRIDLNVIGHRVLARGQTLTKDATPSEVGSGYAVWL